MLRWTKLVAATLCTALMMVFVSDAARLIAAPPDRSPLPIVLTGAEAKAHMETKWASTPALALQHARNVADLSRRGYKPTDRYITVMSPLEDPSLVRRVLELVSPGLAAQSFSDSRGELNYWAWDDGNNATFEADTYMENYPEAAALSAAVQFDISNEQTQVVYANSAYDSLVFYAQCAIVGCGGGLALCIITGPAWGWCAGTRCLASEIGCAAGAAFRHVFTREP